MIKILLAIILTVLSFVSYGQRRITGRVLDSETRKPLDSATVSIEGKNSTTQSNALGFFQLLVDSTDALNIQCPGYYSGKVQVPSQGGLQVLLEKNDCAEYKGGFRELYEFWGSNLKYPSKARFKNLQGRVYISFEVDTTGILKNVKVLKDIGENSGEEIIRVIKLTPNQWIPVDRTCTFILPIHLRLRKDIFEPSLPAEQSLDNDLIKSVDGKLLSEITLTAFSKK